MRIRFSVVILAVLGIGAAFAAAMLTASMRAAPLQEARHILAPETQILVAATSLPAMSVLLAEACEQRAIPAQQAPPGSLSNPAQAVGKLLTMPVVEGQAITSNLFAPDGSGQHIAGLLEPGMRAVSVSLSDYSGMEGLLYPGCRVDVMGTFQIRQHSNIGSAVSTALLQNVQVLAVGRHTVGSPDEEARNGNPNAVHSRRILVTLMVDANQAEALQLGMEHGHISLAMRNPHDSETGSKDATLLSEGRLAQLAKLLDPTVAPSAGRPAPAGLIGEQPVAAAAPEPPADPPPSKPAQRRAAPDVKVNVIRGTATETVSFPCPQG